VVAKKKHKAIKTALCLKTCYGFGGNLCRCCT